MAASRQDPDGDNNCEKEYQFSFSNKSSQPSSHSANNKIDIFGSIVFGAIRVSISWLVDLVLSSSYFLV